MRIRLLDTVEGTHPSVVTDPDTEKPTVRYEPYRFAEGQVVDVDAALAKRLIKVGHAEPTSKS